MGWVLFIKAIRKLCVTSTEKYFSTMDRNIDLIFLQTSPCVKQGFPNSSKGKRRDGGGGKFPPPTQWGRDNQKFRKNFFLWKLNTSIKIKISIWPVYPKSMKHGNKNGTGAIWLQLKMKFLLGYNLKLVI